MFIVGATAVGKTALSLELAKMLGGEIINADSMQVYRGMDIGTGKPTQQERRIVSHHLFDILDPSEEFDVTKYQKLALMKIKEVLTRGALPIVVGGTGLYINSLVYEFEFVAVSDNSEHRRLLEEQLASQGLDSLYSRLGELDPEATQKIHINDTFRVLRALELLECGYRASKRNMKKKVRSKEFVPCVIALNFEDRSLLYDRINARVDLMFEMGLCEEARGLLSGDLSRSAKQAIGYKEFEGFFAGEVKLDSVLDLIKKNSRNYAKRQLTWFKRIEKAIWIDANKPQEDTLNFIKEMLI